MEEKIIDMHMHTRHSDGEFSVEQLLSELEKLRIEKGLEYISITDHDSVEAYLEIKDSKIRKIYGGTIITGTELSFNLNNRLYDLLGYGINVEKMDDLLNNRMNFSERLMMQEKLLKEFKDVCKTKTIEYDDSLEVTTGRKHEAFNVLFDSISDFEKYPANKKFAEYISKSNIALFYKSHFSNPDSSFFVNEAIYSPTLDEAIRMIHDCGGLAFLAHSYAYGLQNTVNFIEYAIEKGIDGIEKYYSTFTEENEMTIEEIASKKGLFVSGGTDFHGPRVKPGIYLASGNGNMKINFATIEKWVNNYADFNGNKINFDVADIMKSKVR